MSLTPDQMGLVNPLQVGAPDTQPGGAILPEAGPPADVMEAPSYAFGESHAPDSTESPSGSGSPHTSPLPASWLGASGVTGGGSSGVTGTPTPEAIWDSPNNPYKTRAEALERLAPNPVDSLRRDLESIPSHTQNAIATLVANGYDEQHAVVLAMNAARAAQAEIQLAINQHATAPAAKQIVATDIAQRFSLPGITLDPREIAGERTVAGMEARARTLVETRRNQGVQTRQAQRVDTVENSTSVTGGSVAATTGLNAFETIRAGLKSSSRRR